MVLGRIMAADSKRILTDPFMLFMYVAPWLTAIGVKLLWLHLSQHYPDWPLEDYEFLMSVAVALMVSLNMGIVLGFQLLEEKEQGVFKAIAVTPLNHSRYLLYRFMLVMVISTLLAYISHIILNFYQVQSMYLLMVLALAAMQVPLQALIISSFANNTVEGFAAMKATGFLLLVPLLIVQFISDNSLSWLAGIFPYFWVIKAYQYIVLEDISAFLITFVVGMIYQLALIGFLVRLYCKRALN